MTRTRPAPWTALRPRERRLAAAAAGLIGCWALLSWAVQPLWEHLGNLRAQADLQAEKLDALGRLLAQGPATEQRYRVMAAAVRWESSDTSQADLLHDLEGLARQASLQLNLKPRPPKARGGSQVFEVELDVEGPQAKLLTFVDAVLGLPRLVAVERLRLSGIPTREGVLRANLVLQQLPLP